MFIRNPGGIGDLKCSTCVENQVPKIARPESSHEHRDFGDEVSVDGLTWTNKAGNQFHIYHVLDQSTLYHTAVVTRSHNAEQAINALHQGWWLMGRSARTFVYGCWHGMKFRGVSQFSATAWNQTENNRNRCPLEECAHRTTWSCVTKHFVQNGC